MTTRTTLTHADEIYVGNAFKGGYSPDGRRGIQMTHMYAHEFLSTASVPPTAGDVDGILSSYATPTLLSPTALGAEGTNFLSLCSGALVTAGSTILEFDVPRNIVMSATGANATQIALQVRGLDVYGDPMTEVIQGGASTVFVSGVRCFKSIHHLSYLGASAALATTPPGGIVSMGTGNRLGLPFHLADKGRLIAVTMNSNIMRSSGATGDNVNIVHIGASSATTITTSYGSADVRGSVEFSSPALDGAIRVTALMMVDATTKRKAFGPPQVTAATNPY